MSCIIPCAVACLSILHPFDPHHAYTRFGCHNVPPPEPLYPSLRRHLAALTLVLRLGY